MNGKFSIIERYLPYLVRYNCTFNQFQTSLFYLVKKALEFIVYTNLWVATAVASLVHLTQVLLGYTGTHVVAFSFFATLLMYAYARWFVSPAREDRVTSKLTDWKSDNKLLYLLSGLVGGIGAMWYLLALSKASLVVVVICAGVSALYPVQFLKKGALALRNVAGLKLFIISAVWTLVTVALPTVEAGAAWGYEQTLISMQRFLFVMAITIPFDIRDLRIDHPDLNTLPYRIGIKPARNLARLAILFAEAIALVLFFLNSLTLPALIAQLIAFEMASLFIHRSTPKKTDLFFSLGVEGTSVLLFLLVYIFTYFWP